MSSVTIVIFNNEKLDYLKLELHLLMRDEER